MRIRMKDEGLMFNDTTFIICNTLILNPSSLILNP
jgi:hypothetical protein